MKKLSINKNILLFLMSIFIILSFSACNKSDSTREELSSLVENINVDKKDNNNNNNNNNKNSSNKERKNNQNKDIDSSAKEENSENDSSAVEGEIKPKFDEIEALFTDKSTFLIKDKRIVNRINYADKSDNQYIYAIDENKGKVRLTVSIENYKDAVSYLTENFKKSADNNELIVEKINEGTYMQAVVKDCFYFCFIAEGQNNKTYIVDLLSVDKENCVDDFNAIVKAFASSNFLKNPTKNIKPLELNDKLFINGTVSELKISEKRAKFSWESNKE